jgi:hypothetical protein
LLAVNGRAKDELRRIIFSRTENPQAAVRLITSRPGEFGLQMDTATTDDHVVEHDGKNVLLVDHELSNTLGEYTLAFEDKKFVMAKGPLSGFNKRAVTFYGEKGK